MSELALDGDWMPEDQIDFGQSPSKLADERDHAANPSDPNQVSQEIDYDAVWKDILAKLRAHLGEDVYSSWFMRLELENVDNGVVTLSAATRFLRTWLMSHFKDQIANAWKQEINNIHRVDIRVRGALHVQSGTSRRAEADETSSSNEEPIKSAAARRVAGIRHDVLDRQKFGYSNVNKANASTPLSRGVSGGFGDKTGRFGSASLDLSRPEHLENSLLHSISSSLDGRFAFDNFSAGIANQVAFEAAKAVASANSETPVLYNPLYIHGGVGLGKTHLLQATANLASRSDRQVVYLTAERFMSNFVRALKTEKALQFKEQLRSIDLLLIDDMQFLTGKSIQQEFCHLLNALIDGGRQVMVAADRPASELESIDERVRSRLQGGATVQIAHPDKGLRRSILDLRWQALSAQFGNVELPSTVLDYVASVITTNGRDLDGALNRLVCHAQMSRDSITVDTAERALADLIGRREPRKVPIDDILRIVSQHYSIPRQELISARRTRTIVLPRQIAMYLAKNITPRSLPEIGKKFGGRDHTTVLHAIRKIEGLISKDQRLKQEVDLLRKLIEQ